MSETIVACRLCKKGVTIPMSKEELEEKLKLGGCIQNILPNLTDAQREMFQTGFCEECWKKMFKEEEEY